MDDENLQLQIDEVEALSSIYGSDWVADDRNTAVFSILIKDEGETKCVCLQVTIPPDYPLTSPPRYELNAPWMSRGAKISLANKLENIYEENKGESVIYLWVECIREYIQQYTSADNSPVDSQASVHAEPLEFDDDIEEGDKVITDDIIEQAQLEDTMAEDTKDCPVIHHSDFLKDRKSTFQAHLAEVHSVDEVKLVLESLLSNKKIKAATHNIQAYRIIQTEPRRLVISDQVDDGEYGASGRMLNVMQLANVENALVVVTRWYGGIHLGPDRFKHINSMTREMLDSHGFIKAKEKKGPRSKKTK